MAQKWYGQGIYSKMRGDREQFFVRVWLPTSKKIAVFKAGGTPKSADRERIRVMQDPEKAYQEREAKQQEASAGLTVKQLYEQFTGTYRGHGGTDYYCNVLRPLSEDIGRMRACDMTLTAYDAHVARRKAQRTDAGRPRVGDSTMRKECIAASKMFKWARRRGLVPTNPFADYEKPKEPAGPEARPLTYEEEDKVLTALPPLEADLVAWLCDTGMRYSEGRLVTWSQIDKPAGVVHVISGKGKRAKARRIPLNLSDRLTAIMERHPRRIGTPYLFHDEEGKPLDLDRLNGMLAAAMKGAGIELPRGTLWNVTRKTAENRMFDAGLLPQVTCDILGHSLAIADKHYRQHQSGKQQQTAGLLNRPAVVARGVAG